MKITSSELILKSESFASQSTIKNEYLNYWESDSDNSGNNQFAEVVDTLSLSEEAQSAYKNSLSIGRTEDDLVYKISDKDRNKIYMLEAFMERLTGKKFKFSFFEKISLNKNNPNNTMKAANAADAEERVGWGLQYSYYERYEEREAMSFSAKGVINTADGHKISIDLELNMSRQFIEENSLEIKAGDALIDPIVINFDGSAASLTEEKYTFDLDSDGTGDEISFVGSGSGLLALDLNEDGIINNGTELFGPNTQDGFAELSEYDLDGNGWIDENDPIFDKLRIWTKDENGNDQLFALGQKGVGAIYLGNVESEFSIKDTSNNLQGQIRSSSIFLSEDGDVGIVHQIDLAKSESSV